MSDRAAAWLHAMMDTTSPSWGMVRDMTLGALADMMADADLMTDENTKMERESS